jgi:spermidine/putrescine transport system substrate-binding protein
MNLKLLSSCGVAFAVATFAANAASAAGDLYLYTWGAYTPPDLIQKFETKYDVQVHVDTYDSNETMLAKIKSGATGYDVLVPSDYMVAILIKEDLLAKIEPNSMSNYANVEDKWKDVYWDAGRHYSVPWAWGTTSFVVDTDIVKTDPNTLAQIFDPADGVKGKINMLRDINEVINAGLRYLQLPRCNGNPQDLKKVLDLLMTQKSWVKSYNSDTKELLVSGEAKVSQSWNGYALRARLEKPSLKYAYPKEGLTGFMDNLVVPKSAPNLENAKLFVNFMMEPENAALVSNYAKYSNAIKDSKKFMDPALAEAPELNLPAGTPDPEFVPPCDPTVVELYDKLWTKLLR